MHLLFDFVSIKLLKNEIKLHSFKQTKKNEENIL